MKKKNKKPYFPRTRPAISTASKTYVDRKTREKNDRRKLNAVSADDNG